MSIYIYIYIYIYIEGKYFEIDFKGLNYIAHFATAKCARPLFCCANYNVLTANSGSKLVVMESSS
jgi:hypothetical protein